MAGEPIVTFTGNLGADAEFRKTPNGIPVATFNVCNTPRKQINGEWTDGEPMWFRVFVWNREASGTAVTLKKGDKVIVTGRFSKNTYTDKEGVERTSLEINADSVGVVPRNAPEPVEPVVDIRSDEDPIDSFPW